MNLTSKQNEIVRFIWNYRKTRGISPTLSEIAEQLGVSKITIHEHISLLEKKGAIKKDKYQSRSLKLSRAVVRELEQVDDERERRGLPPVAVADVSPSGESSASSSSSSRETAPPPSEDTTAAAPVRGGRGNGGGGSTGGHGSSGGRATAASARSGVGEDGLTVPLRGRIAAGRPLDAVEDSEELDIAAVLRLDRASYALRVRGNSMIDDGIHDGDYVLVDESRKDPQDGETVVAILEGTEATLKRFYREGGRFKLMPANSELSPISVDPDKLEIRGVVVGQLRRY